MKVPTANQIKGPESVKKEDPEAHEIEGADTDEIEAHKAHENKDQEDPGGYSYPFPYPFL